MDNRGVALITFFSIFDFFSPLTTPLVQKLHPDSIQPRKPPSIQRGSVAGSPLSGCSKAIKWPRGSGSLRPTANGASEPLAQPVFPSTWSIEKKKMQKKKLPEEITKKAKEQANR